ncbi:Translocating chain-associated membrane protein 2 [Cichlidogyrus casuarinus]|uniref:Translocating chain-associated membrane protein 2 n=1 Tax=Cichlidogyrus casuarinus TaxID=1844966 RepID=A0ABD2PY25_9PLAT
MSLKLSKKKSKQPNYFSHDFIITNHGDICSIAAMVFVVGLLFKGTTPLAAKFILMQHNVSDTPINGRMLYHNGLYDLCACIFYIIVVIVLHAIIQEYLLDKLSKRMGMMKGRLSKFNHVSQTAIFLAFSIYYICSIIYQDGMFKSISDLWEGYPHTPVSLWTKFFFVFQISYWAHNIPELYFQKVKKEDIVTRITPSIFFLIGISAAYSMNFIKIAILILLIQYSSDFVFYFTRATELALKTNVARIGFSIWNTIFIPARIIIICLTFLTLQYGLSRVSKSTISIPTGDFNTRLIRLNCLVFVFLSQAWMMWVFVNYHLKKRREKVPTKSTKMNVISNQDKKKKKIG